MRTQNHCAGLVYLRDFVSSGLCSTSIATGGVRAEVALLQSMPNGTKYFLGAEHKIVCKFECWSASCLAAQPILAAQILSSSSA